MRRVITVGLAAVVTIALVAPAASGTSGGASSADQLLDRTRHFVGAAVSVELQASERIEFRAGARPQITTVSYVLDSATRAIHCADDILTDAQMIGLQVRAGVHTGEIERRGDDIAGLAVNIARRICDRAGPAQVLVSESVKSSIVGSGIPLTDQGPVVLKGVPDEMRVYAVKR